MSTELLASIDGEIANAPKQLVDGIYSGVPLEDYLRWPILSQSMLKEGRASMAHLKAAMDRELEKKVTDDMKLGSALHTCFLEPEYAADRIAIWRKGRRYGAEWDGFCDEHASKVILTINLHARLVGMVKALRKHPFVREWSSKIEAVEISKVGLVQGVRMKGRCDALTSDPLVDLKKVKSADVASFTRTVLNFGYEIQGATYTELYQRERFVFVGVEGTPPYDVMAYELSPALLRHGRRQAAAIIDRYKVCCEIGIWPGRCSDPEPVTLEMPGWLSDQINSEITFGGAAFVEESEEENGEG